MEQLQLYIKKRHFFIESKNFKFENLRIEQREKIRYFKQVDSNTWSIEISAIKSILIPQTEDRAYIYFGNEKNQISSENFEIIAKSDLFFVDQPNEEIYFYVSLDSYLRFIQQQKPTAKAYYESCELLKITPSINNSIKLHLKIISKFFALNEINFIVSNRKEKIQKTFDFYPISSNYLGENKFENIFEILFTPSIEIPELKSRFDYFDYDTSVFDFWFNINIEELPLTKYRFRIPYSELVPSESWCEFNDEEMISLNWYGTGYGNLSSRIVILKKDVYKQYLTIIDDKKSGENITNNKKPIILVTEYPYKAQENGLIFFQYLMEKQNIYEPYYIISENSPDLKKLENYRENVLFYKSVEHIKIFYKAQYIAHTHTPNYALPFLSKHNEMQRNQMKKIFLQHGIIGVRNLEYMYGRKTHPLLINKFVVSSRREYEIVRDELFYPEEDIALTGLARFDRLLSGNNILRSFSLRKNILIMPTWRNGLELLPDDKFMQTQFYEEIYGLINDNAFREIAKRKKLTINLYLHNNFQKYNHLFKSDFVKILSSKEVIVQDLLKSHGILITDYSSVGLDFAIQKRAVLYFQFDEKLKEQRDDTERENSFLPGPIFTDRTTLIQKIRNKTTFNQIDYTYKKQLKETLYKYMDQKACKRIFDVLKEM